MSASMQDVADRAGVSVATVSRALRQSPLVSADTRTRVLAAADAMSFSVSRTASSLATGRLGRVGVLVSGSLGAWFNGSILDGIYATLSDAGHELLIYRINDTTQRERFFATLPARRNADALIVASFALTDDEQVRLQDLSEPLVYLNQRVPDAASVSIDDVAGARAAARHLINLGHRRIAFVETEKQSGFFYSAGRRVQGYRAELAAAGVSAEELLILTARSTTDGDQVLAQFLAAAPMPTALMVESDELAMNVMAACWRMGLRIPEDVSVIGFDDHAMADTFGLSTIAQPVDELGRQAAALALTLVERATEHAVAAALEVPAVSQVPSTVKVTATPVLEVSIATQLVLRSSTAKARRPDAEPELATAE